MENQKNTISFKIPKGYSLDDLKMTYTETLPDGTIINRTKNIKDVPFIKAIIFN